MPYTIAKVQGKDCYMVIKGKTVAMKCGTLANAKKQVKLLNMLDHRTYANK